MTPRIKETDSHLDLAWFSESLFGQMNGSKKVYEMSGINSFSELIHPAIMKCQYMFQKAPQELRVVLALKNYHLVCFSEETKAKSHHPKAKVYGGFPYQISQFLNDSPQEAILNFGKMGAIFLSKTECFDPPLIPELHHFVLPLWLDYALSEELWGPKGKWIRFHERLHTLFENNGLLIEQDHPGYYPLKVESSWISDHGFKGNKTDSSFVLVAAWDFPLSGLVELEKLMAREL